MYRSIAAMIFFLFSCFTYGQENLRPDHPVAFVGAMLLDGYEAKPIHRATVVIYDGRITAVGESHNTEIPKDATIINISGKTIMPGLIDAHVHTCLLYTSPSQRDRG